jgi:hypothetical protein
MEATIAMAGTSRAGRAGNDAVPCIVRLSRPLTAARLDDLQSGARGLGHLVFVADLLGCHEKDDLLARIAAALAAPGAPPDQWGAWFDLVVDLGWLPPAGGYVIVLLQPSTLVRDAPEVLDTALALCEDAARVWASRGVAFRMVVDATTDLR